MASVLQIGRMPVPAKVDAERNAWYSGEYVPGYRKVPGVIYARRYRVLEGTSGYGTVYEFASTAVPESPEWKQQQATFVAQFPAHAPGHDARIRFAWRVRAGECLRARIQPRIGDA